MRTLAAGVHQLAGRAPNMFDLYLVGDVLVDDVLTYDPARQIDAKLAALRPALVLFGHGAPLRDRDRLACVAG